VLPLWAFVAVTVPLVLTPGVSTAVVLRNSIAGGTRAGLLTAVGINVGSLFYGLLTAFGFALAVRSWPGAWSVLRAAGGLYLAWLGVQSLRHAWRRRPAVAPDAGAAPRHAGHHIYEGFLTNALNPSIAAFYLIVLPQFIPRGAPIVRSALLLTAVHIALAATWHVAWAAAGGRLAASLTGGRPRQVLDAIAGIALIALAVTVVVTG
jgi:threonine/homoserine/homoserine lactone efflux protein